MTMLSFYNVILIQSIKTSNTLYYTILMKIGGKMIIYKFSISTTITLKGFDFKVKLRQICQKIQTLVLTDKTN